MKTYVNKQCDKLSIADHRLLATNIRAAEQVRDLLDHMYHLMAGKVRAAVLGKVARLGKEKE